MTFGLKKKHLIKMLLAVFVPLLCILFFAVGLACSVSSVDTDASAASYGDVSAPDLLLYSGSGDGFTDFTKNTFAYNQLNHGNITNANYEKIVSLYQYHKNYSDSTFSSDAVERKTIRSYTAACFTDQSASLTSHVFCDTSLATPGLSSVDSGHVLAGSNIFYTGEAVTLTDYIATVPCGVLYFTQFPDSKSDFSLCATFYLSDFLKQALQDSLLTVSITPYILTVADSIDTSGSLHADGVIDTAKDSCNIICSYYNPNFETSIGTSPSAKTIKVPVGYDYVSGDSLTLQPGNYNDTANGDKAFVQVNLSKFIASGERSIALGEIGICVEVTPNEAVMFDNSSTYTVSGITTYYDATYLANEYYFAGKWAENCTKFYSYNTKTYAYDQISSGTAFDETVTYYMQCINRNKTESTRYVSQTATRYASIGSTIDFSIILRRDSQQVYLEQTLADSANALCSGKVFKQLFNPTASTTIEFKILQGEVQDDWTQSSGSGQNAHLVVKGGDSNNLLVIYVAIYYIDLIDGSKTPMKSGNQTYTVYIDNDSPYVPSFDKEESFYSAYFGSNAVYYTGSTNDEIQSMDVVENINIVDDYNYIHLNMDALNLSYDGKLYNKIHAGSDLSVYYKASYYGETMPTVASDKVSKGFSFSVNDVLDAEGEDLYLSPCALSPNGTYIGRYASVLQIDDESTECELTYSSLRISTAYYNFTRATEYQAGTQYYTKSGKKYLACSNLSKFEDNVVYYVRDDKLSYRKSGVWAIEFMSYDNVGNSTYATTKLFIKVDITEYEFEVSLFLGDTTIDSPEMLSSSDFKLSYIILSPAGTLKGGSSKTIISDDSFILHRGDNVYLSGAFQGNGASTYALTSLQIGGNTKQSCTDFIFVGTSSVAFEFTNTGTTDKYTFSVSKTFCDKEEYRTVKLFFKNRVTVSASKTSQKYDGENKVIAPYATYQGSTLQKVTIKTTYYRLMTETAGDYAVGTDIPNNDSVFVVLGNTNTLSATGFKNTHFIAASGQYATGVYYYKKISTEGSAVPVHTGTYYCEEIISNDNTYYGCSIAVLTVSAGVPDISTLYAIKGNTAGQKISMVYGTSLSVIDWSADYRESGKQVANESIGCYLNNDKVIDRSSNGVVGYYKLNVSDKTSKEYTRPSAGIHYIGVEFVPVMGSYSSSTGEVTFTYDDDGKFIENTDYEHVLSTIVVSISPLSQSYVSFVLNEDQGEGYLDDDTVIYTYDGNQKSVLFSLTSDFENADGTFCSEKTGIHLNLASQASVYYAKVTDYLTEDFDESTLYFDSAAPYSAGLYLVRITLQETATCNYEASFDCYVEIEKIVLTVSLSDQSYDYQYEYKPLPSFYDTLGVSMDVNYTYSFYPYTSGSLEDACNEKSGKVAISGSNIRPYIYTPIASGKYAVKVEVEADNYAGTGYALYTIKTVGEKNNYTVKSWPNVISSTTTHLTYGQPIGETSLTSGSGYYIRYTYRTYASETPTEISKSVSGKFFVAYIKYDDWCEKNSRTDSNNSRVQYYSEMKYYVPDAVNASGYSMFICFGAFTETNGMEFNMNFDFLYNDGITVSVGKAQTDWSKVAITPLSYGTTVSSIEDITISKNVGLFYSSNGLTPLGKSVDVDYYYRGTDVYVFLTSLGIDYSYGLNLSQETLFVAGKHDLYVSFSINDSNFDNDERAVTITIEKKVLDISIADNTFTSVYNNYAEDEKLWKSFRYTPDVSLVLSGTLVYSANEKTYTKSKEGYQVQYSTGSGEVTETVSALPAGSYSVRYTIVNDNYAGVLEMFTLVIEKARLMVKTQPDITDESNTVCYGKNISDIRFYNGEMISASESGEKVEGTFTISSSHIGQTFGNYNTTASIYWIFIPKDTNNYKTFRGEFTAQNGYSVLNGEGQPSGTGQDKDIYYDALNYTLYYWNNGWQELSDVLTQGFDTKEELFANNRKYSIGYAYWNNTVYALNKVGETVVAVMNTEYRCYYDKKVNKANLSDYFTMTIATYTYSAGHTGVYTEGECLALGKNFVEETFSVNGFTFSEYVLTYLDKKIVYKTGFPELAGMEESRFTITIPATLSGEYISAGVYEVTLSIKDTENISDPTYNYRGDYKTYLTVSRQRAYIVLENDEEYDYAIKTVYNAKTQKVSPLVYDALGNKISLYVSQGYYKNGVLISVPTAIGGYDVRLSLGDTRNYMLVTSTYQNGWVIGESAVSFVTASMTVGVNVEEISFTNLNQTYSQVKNVMVDMGMNDATCTLEYMRLQNGQETGTRYTEAPVSAGEYNVHLIFDGEVNNGYSDDITWSEKLVIEKYTASIVCTTLLATTYTGKPREIFTAYTDPYGLSVSYSYTVGGENEQAITLAQIGALDAGTYEIIITIDDNNYCGTKVCTLTVKPATATVRTVPSFGDFVYDSDEDVIINAETGSVYCTETGNADIQGQFILSKDTMKGVAVGNKQVSYTFVPNSNNYAELSGKTTVKVVARDISDKMSGFVNLVYDSSYCSLNEQEKVTEYNEQAHALTVKFEEEQLVKTIYRYEADNSDFSVSLLYNGYAEAPSAIGRYTVQAVVKSKNYTGSLTFAKPLVIEQGTPTIVVLPTVVGEGSFSLTAGHNTISTDMLQGGKAVMSSNNVTVRGSFTIPETTFTKANKNAVEGTFTPENADFYKAVSFTIYVQVIGKDSLKMDTGSGYTEKTKGTTINGNDWTGTVETGRVLSYPLCPVFSHTVKNLSVGAHQCGVMICIAPANGSSSLTYGVKLSAFTVSFVPVSDCATCQGYVDMLNDCGELSFTDNSVVPDVGSSVSVQYKLYDNVTDIANKDELNDMLGKLTMTGILTPVAFDETTKVEVIGFIGQTVSKDSPLRIESADGTLYETNPSEVEYDFTKTVEDTDRGTEIHITKFVSTNYVFTSYPKIYLSVYTLLDESKIAVQKTGKDYDGQGISVVDIVPSALDTASLVEQQYFSVLVYNENGEECDGIAIGNYTVVITLKDSKNYYYGEKTISFTVSRRDISEEITVGKTEDTYGSSGYDIAPKAYYQGKVLTDYTVRFRKAGTDDAFVSSITEAGTYDMRVLVDGTNYYGTKLFTYTVQPQTVVMKTQNNETTFIVSYGSSAPNVTVSFYVDGESSPRNLGKYTTYYSGAKYSKSTVVPTDAGTYTVTVELADTNYRLTGNTYTYIISAKSVQVDVAPTVLSKNDGEFDYNLKYGQKVKEIIFVDGTGKASSDDIEVEGSFTVSEKDADTVLSAGTHEITLLFTPTDVNYSSAETKVSIVVAKVEATVVFTNLQADYTGTGRASFLTYTVTPEIPVRIQFVSAIDSTVLNVPVNAGSYLLQVSTTDTNYTVKISSTQEGTTPVFVVNKAQVRKVEDPTALPVSVGENLMKSSLNNGKVYYNGFNNAVDGTFTYISLDAFSKTGVYTVQYLFTPTLAGNFDLYYGSVPVTVNKGTATITVDNNQMTYGTGVDFTKISFTTKPAGLPVQFNTQYRGTTYKNGDIMDAGVYYFTCWVESDNYTSDVLEFAYTVQKKEIDLSLVDEKGEVATAFTVLYGKKLTFSYKMYDANDLSGKRTYLMRDADTVYKNVQYVYKAKETESFTYEDSLAPTALGSYYLTANLVHANYTASVTVTYKVVKGTVESISFDTDSLLKQVYGGVSAPIVLTVPSDVSYYIIYQGYDRVMPTSAGSYNITVYVDDESYNATQVSAVFRINPKKVSVTDITVQNRVYNGTSTVDISGTLSGVLYGDEVQLVMKAKTADDSSSVGTHLVTITEYKMTGLMASNYELEEPKCDSTISIYNNVVQQADGSSYITCTSGFEEGTAITFKTVDSENNKTSFVTKALGVESTIIEYTITLNGEATIVKDQYKICVEIPEEYRNVEFDVTMAGGLSGQSISYTREGNYITFYASVSSGQVVFNKAQFKYTIIVLVVAAVILILGVVAIFILNPLQHRRKLGNRYAEKQAIRKIKKG